MKQKHSNLQWSRLDNAARIYPALASQKATRVFRLYCQLTEPVDPEALQRAADRAVAVFPEFAHTIRSGFFWNYREDAGLRPVVHEENQTPCQPLYSANVHELLMDISYYRRRINFEIFHAIADGLGASVFFRALVLFYLEEAHPELKGCGAQSEVPREEPRENDAFRQHTGQYRGEGTTSLLGDRTGKVYRFQGQRMPDRRQLVTEITVSAARIRAAAKEYHATVTAFLSALLLLSIRVTMPPKRRDRIISLAVPVDLRGHFASDTLRNFFSLVEVRYDPRQGSGELEQVVDQVRQMLAEELTKEKLGSKITHQVTIGNRATIRSVPLPLKQPVIQLTKWMAERNSTMVFSNVGRMDFPPEAQPWVEQCGAYLSSTTRQLVLCSYGDRMVLSFAGALMEKDVERALLRRLNQYDPEVTVVANYGSEVWNIP